MPKNKNPKDFRDMPQFKDQGREALRLRSLGNTVAQVAKILGVGERHVYKLTKKALERSEVTNESESLWDLRQSLGESPEKTDFLLELSIEQGDTDLSVGEAAWAWQISRHAIRHDYPTRITRTIAYFLDRATDDWQFELLLRLIQIRPWEPDQNLKLGDYFNLAGALIKENDDWAERYVCNVPFTLMMFGSRDYLVRTKVKSDPCLYPDLVDRFMDVWEAETHEDFHRRMDQLGKDLP